MQAQAEAWVSRKAGLPLNVHYANICWYLLRNGVPGW